MDTEFSDIPISMLRQFVFCRRIPFLVMVKGLDPPRGEWVNQGQKFHLDVERLMKRRDLQKLELSGPYEVKWEQPLFAPLLGIHGTCDAILKILDSGELIPLELKLSEKAKASHGEILQLAGYAAAIEESLCSKVKIGFILHGFKNRQTRVEFTPDLHDAVRKTINAIQDDCSRGLLPHSDADDRKCAQCEFLNFCADRL